MIKHSDFDALTDMMIMTTNVAVDDENLMENMGGDKTSPKVVSGFGGDTCPKVWLELFCQVFFWAEVRPRRHLNCTPEIRQSLG